MDDVTQFTPNLARYEALMDVVRNRLTSRAFRPHITVPREHIELVLEAARHAPSGANAQPWHYIVVIDPAVKKSIAGYFVVEPSKRVKLTTKFPTPNYRGLETAPQTTLRSLIDVPEGLAIIDIMVFGVPAKPPFKRWEKSLAQIVSWNRHDMNNNMTIDDIESWVREIHHKVTYRGEAKGN